MNSHPRIAAISLDGNETPNAERAICAASGELAHIPVDAPLPRWASGLLLMGSDPFLGETSPVPPALFAAIDVDLPILALESGLHALNLAFGGRSPVPLEGRAALTGPGKRRIFLAPGGKVADAIGGAGPVTVSAWNSHSVLRRCQAGSLMSTAFAVDDGSVQALELPGRHWILGVQWRAACLDEQPAGFDNLFHAFVGAAEGR